MHCHHVGVESIISQGQREGTTTATWGQRYMWDIIKSLEPWDDHLNMALVEPIPPGTSLATVLDALRRVLSAYDTFRTSYRLDPDGRLVQVLAARQRFDVDIYQVRGAYTEDDLRAGLAHVITDRFPPEDTHQLRCAVVLHEDTPIKLLLALSHITMDLWAISVVHRQLRDLLAGRPVTFGTHQPFDQAAYEAGPRGQHRNRAALDYWERSVKEFPTRYPGEGSRAAERPRYQTCVLTSTRMFLAARSLAASAKVSLPTVLTVAFARLIGEATGLPRVPLLTRTNNRTRPALLTAVGHYAQQAPIMVDVSLPFDEMLRAAHRAGLSAYYHGTVDPVELAQRLRPAAGSPGPALTMTINHRRPASLPGAPDPVRIGAEPPRAGDTGPATIAWSGGRDYEHISLYCDTVPAEHTFAIFLDTTFLRRDELERLMWRMEADLLERAGSG